MMENQKILKIERSYLGFDDGWATMPANMMKLSKRNSEENYGKARIFQCEMEMKINDL